MQGLADALLDPAVSASLVGGQDLVSLVHWSGYAKQRLSVPWIQIQTKADVKALADRVRRIKRPQDHTDTAIGQALFFALAQFPAQSDCRRQVIDLSGDGAENAGDTLPAALEAVEARGIILNGIAIELDGVEPDLTDYFRRFVVAKDGFVIIAGGLQDYPRAIRAKLLRELSQDLS